MRAPSLGERLCVVPDRAAAEFDRLPFPVRDILRLCDGTRTFEAICAASPLQSAQTESVLERLLTMGVIAVRSQAPRQRRLTPEGLSWVNESPAQAAPETVPSESQEAIGFSQEEELFFAQSIEHLLEEA
jgi:hypothetical protein